MRLLLIVVNPVAAILITLLLFSSSAPNSSSDYHHHHGGTGTGTGLIRVSTALGINYGQVGNNLPPPQKVITLIRSLNITKVRIYDTNPEILSAFANTNIELIVTIENNLLPSLTSPQSALNWVNTRIKPYFPSTHITSIDVGNEIFNSDDNSLTNYVVPAMIAIHSALLQLGFSQYISVSSPNSLAVLAVSYPPSSGMFRPELIPVLTQFLSFLSSTNSPFWINAYPYFAYKDNPSQIPLDYALSNPTGQGMTDPSTKLHYDNMLYAQVDSAIFAIARMGYTSIEVKVSETGWPSKGDVDEVGANVVNAAVYNRNLLRRQVAGQGTPVRPGFRLDVYMFALFNEDMKPGPTSERNYGLFHPDCTMAYNVGISSLMSTNGDSADNDSPASISLTSHGSKVRTTRCCQSLVYWTFVYLLLHYLNSQHY